MTAPSPFLSYAAFRFHLKVTTFMELPPYKGAVFRGAFGSNFRKLVCAAPENPCEDCRFHLSCLYVAIFEPPPPAHYPEAGKFRQAPRPYIINPPLLLDRRFEPGDSLTFELVLVGRTIEALPYFMVIFSEMGRQGLGRTRGKYRLTRVDLLSSEGALPIYDHQSRSLRPLTKSHGPIFLPEDAQADTLTLHFLTPLRLKQKGDLVTRFSFPLFFARLAQRLSLLASFYERNPDLPDLTPLISQAHLIQVAPRHLRWYDWERYSRRQDTTMKFGGLVGRVVLSGPLGPFLPYLRLGSQVNVGQETTFGLGKFQLEFPENTTGR